MCSISNNGFRLGKSTLDNGFGMFRSMLTYKLSERGGAIVKVGRMFPSSQRCSCCGKIHPEMKDMNVRTMRCKCGLALDRDHNAAINIKNEGLRLLGAREVKD
jgi:putative transposase